MLQRSLVGSAVLLLAAAAEAKCDPLPERLLASAGAIDVGGVTLHVLAGSAETGSSCHRAIRLAPGARLGELPLVPWSTAEFFGPDVVRVVPAEPVATARGPVVRAPRSGGGQDATLELRCREGTCHAQGGELVGPAELQGIRMPAGAVFGVLAGGFHAEGPLEVDGEPARSARWERNARGVTTRSWCPGPFEPDGREGCPRSVLEIEAGGRHRRLTFGSFRGSWRDFPLPQRIGGFWFPPETNVIVRDDGVLEVVSHAFLHRGRGIGDWFAGQPFMLPADPDDARWEVRGWFLYRVDLAIPPQPWTPAGDVRCHELTLAPDDVFSCRLLDGVRLGGRTYTDDEILRFDARGVVAD